MTSIEQLEVELKNRGLRLISVFPGPEATAEAMAREVIKGLEEIEQEDAEPYSVDE